MTVFGASLVAVTMKGRRYGSAAATMTGFVDSLVAVTMKGRRYGSAAATRTAAYPHPALSQRERERRDCFTAFAMTLFGAAFAMTGAPLIFG
jgi:hypothetical protein